MGFCEWEWVDTMSIIRNILLEGVSDHCPILVHMVENENRVKPNFKYCNAWSTHPTFSQIVKESVSMFKVVKKLKLMKKRLNSCINSTLLTWWSKYMKLGRSCITYKSNYKLCHFIKHFNWRRRDWGNISRKPLTCQWCYQKKSNLVETRRWQH